MIFSPLFVVLKRPRTYFILLLPPDELLVFNSTLLEKYILRWLLDLVEKDRVHFNKYNNIEQRISIFSFPLFSVINNIM